MVILINNSQGRTHQLYVVVSLFSPAAIILWVHVFHVMCVGHYEPDYVQDTIHHAIPQSYVNAVINRLYC